MENEKEDEDIEEKTSNGSDDDSYVAEEKWQWRGRESFR